MSTYTHNEIQYPSVTTVLGILDKSSALIPWGINMALEYLRQNGVTKTGSFKTKEGTFLVNEDLLQEAKKNYRTVSKEALDIGSAVHDAIECYIKHGKDKTKEEIYSKPDMSGEQKEAIDNAFIAFLEWESENQVKWHCSEQTIIDTENGFAGTMDAVASFGAGEFEGRTFVIDFKSSKDFYDGYGKQVAAYRFGYETVENCVQVDGCGVLRLDKITGQPEFKDYSKDYERKLDAFLALLKFYYADKKRRLKNNPKAR